MKIIKIILFCLCFILNANAQDYVRKGNNFVQISNATRDTLITNYTFTDSKGVQLPVIINRTNGRCYTWRVSSKSGKGYRAYLKNKISKTIANELGIEFKESQPKK